MATVVGYNECVAEIRKASGRDLTDDQIETLLSRVHEVQNRLRRQGVNDPTQLGRMAGQEAGGEVLLAAMREKANAARNALIAQALDKRATPGREASDVREVLTGKEGATRDAAKSIDADKHGIERSILGPMLRDLRKAGLLAPLRRRNAALDRDIARELWRMEDPNGGAPTGNKIAEKTAEILHRAQELARLGQNQAGAWIGKLDHYVTRQSHDMWKIRGDGSPEAFAKWRDAILPKLHESTFDRLESPSDIPRFLHETWKSLSSGVHDTVNGGTKMAAFTGPGNLAKRASQERVLHFKDADSWFDYNTEFGKGGVLDGVNAGIVSGAQNIAVMRVLGTNPEAMFDGWLKTLISRAKDREDFAMIDELSKPWNHSILDVVTGQANVVGGKGTLAKIGVAARTLEQLSKLGGVVLSSIPDLAVNAAMLRHNGIGLFESLGRQLQELVPFKTAEHRERADELATGIDGFLGSVMHRMTSADTPMGKLSHSVEVFHKWTGLTAWTDSLKDAGGLMLTNNLGRNAGKEFADLAPRLQTTLRRYGIEAAEWDGMRGLAAVAEDGRSYLMPESVRAGGNEALADKLQTYLIDQVREGMTEATAGGRAIATWGTKSGTPAGELVRMFMQFKLYTATFMQRSLGRELYRDGVDVGGLATVIAGTTILGYLSMTLKEMAKGRAPREPTDATTGFKLVAAAMTQGGGLGIYGDFLFGEANRMGGGLASTLAGPTVGTMSDALRLFQSYRDGGVSMSDGEKIKGHPAADTVQFLKNNAPFINLFYTRAALDYLVLHSLQESLNPGYLRRYEHQTEKQNAQKFWLAPTTNHLQPFGR
jgi:hypothetical protein